eukprot:1682076-Prymnesium_polylepis.1
MITGVDATASVCLGCALGLQYALQGNASSSMTAGVWTSTFQASAQVDQASSFLLSLYIKTQARSGRTLIVD